jgi:hypothetical protein
LAEVKAGLLSTKMPAPVLVRVFVESTRPVLISAVDPATTEKFALPDKDNVPAPLRIQFPLVEAVPKLRPLIVWLEPTVIVSVTAGDWPRKLAASPATQGSSVVPSADQKAFVPQVPLPDWKPAVVEVSHVTVAAGNTADVRQAA